MRTEFPWRLIAMLGALVLLIAVVGLTVRSCDRRRSADAQSRVDEAQHGALQNSAADAIGSQANVSANAAASEDISRSNEKDIRNAQGSDAAVDPAASAAGLRALCRRETYRDSEQCRLLKLDPRTLEKAR